MATPTIDITFLQYFSPIFVFVLVFVIVYAMLRFTKFMGENKILQSLISFFVAIIFLFSSSATTVVVVLAPWFTVFFIFIVFLLMAYKLFGATDDQIRNVLANVHAVHYTVLIVGIIILLFALGAGFGQELLGFTQGGDTAAATDVGDGSTGSSSYTQNLVATLFNTRVLGMVLILIIAAFTIRSMSASLRPDWP